MVELWPENVQAFDLFVFMQTQWMHTGMSGSVTGLNYLVLFRRLDDMNLPPEKREQLLAEIQAMERAALPEINKTF